MFCVATSGLFRAGLETLKYLHDPVVEQILASNKNVASDGNSQAKLTTRDSKPESEEAKKHYVEPRKKACNNLVKKHSAVRSQLYAHGYQNHQEDAQCSRP